MFGLAFSAAVKGIQAVGTIIDETTKNLPKLIQEAEVTVYGNPGSTKWDLYWIAVSMAFGLVQRRDRIKFNPPAGSITMQYNAELKQIYFAVTQITDYRSFLMKEDQLPLQLTAGPYSSTAAGVARFTDRFWGSNWQWFATNPLISSRFLPTKGTDVNTVWGDQEIITPIPLIFNKKTGKLQISTSPTPPGDGKSRGAPTLANDPVVRATLKTAWYTNPELLLWAALSEPCNAGYLEWADLTTGGGGDFGGGDGGGGDFGGYVPKVPGGGFFPGGLGNSGGGDFEPPPPYQSPFQPYPPVPNTPTPASPPNPPIDQYGNPIYPPQQPDEDYPDYGDD